MFLPAVAAAWSDQCSVPSCRWWSGAATPEQLPPSPSRSSPEQRKQTFASHSCFSICTFTWFKPDKYYAAISGKLKLWWKNKNLTVLCSPIRWHLRSIHSNSSSCHFGLLGVVEPCRLDVFGTVVSWLLISAVSGVFLMTQQAETALVHMSYESMLTTVTGCLFLTCQFRWTSLSW